MVRTPHAAAPITVGYWEYMYLQGRAVITGALAGMCDRDTAVRLIRERSALPETVEIELAYHTYQIPAAEVC